MYNYITIHTKIFFSHIIFYYFLNIELKMSKIFCNVLNITQKKDISGNMKRQEKKTSTIDIPNIDNKELSGKKNSKVRADQLLFDQGLAQSREQAKRYIMAGQVYTGEPPSLVSKPGHPYAIHTQFQLKQKERFVSRGAYKLLTALKHFKLNVANYICLDAGASTGGFTDCLLQHNVSKVYAVYVGHGQLHEKLRQDSRVVNLEKTNLRCAEPCLIPEKVDLVVADVSFISLTMVLQPCMMWLKHKGQLLVLIKPQFEVGAHQTQKGIVRDPLVRQMAVDKIVDFCQLELGLNCHGVVPSEILGPKGNQEYMALFM